MAANQFICVIDDDADYRYLLRTLFNYSCPDYSVQFFPGGKAFLDTLAQMNQHPGLILLDRHMPEFDGHQTLEFLKNHPAYKRIPVVMMSAYATREEINSCYEAGLNSFLSKSLDTIHQKKAIEVICQYWLEFNMVPD